MAPAAGKDDEAKELPSKKPQDTSPIDVAVELPSKGVVRVFKIDVDKLVEHARDEILKGLDDPKRVPAELLPLLEQCAILGTEAFDLVTTPKTKVDPRLWAPRARALALCKRWFLAGLKDQVDKKDKKKYSVDYVIPKLAGWQE